MHRDDVIAQTVSYVTSRALPASEAVMTVFRDSGAGRGGFPGAGPPRCAFRHLPVEARVSWPEEPGAIIIVI